MEATDIRLQLTWKEGLPAGTASAAHEPERAVAFEGWLQLADAVRRLSHAPEADGP